MLFFHFLVRFSYISIVYALIFKNYFKKNVYFLQLLMFKKKSLCTVITHKALTNNRAMLQKALSTSMILKILEYFSLPNSLKIQNYVKYSLAVFLESSPAENKRNKQKALTVQ